MCINLTAAYRGGVRLASLGSSGRIIMVMITICYPPGAGGYFVLSLMQQDPSVCSCVNVGDLWQSTTAHSDWVSVEDANQSASRSCCDRTRCEMTHLTPDQTINHPTQLASRQSLREQLNQMQQTWLIITCTESDRAWLIQNQRRKPYRITDPLNPRQVLPEYEPTRYSHYSARVHIPFQSLWSDQGIRESIEQISHGFDLVLDPEHSVRLARAWWQTQSDVGIESPCV